MGAELMLSALHYAKLGLAVFPLLPRDKRPVFVGWPEAATSDTGMISRWWQQDSSYNIGLATGKKSNMFVVDVDKKNGGDETFDSLVMRYGKTPNTWQQTTGTGGFHLFFRYPNFHVGNSAGLWPGVDIRGERGYVVLPPSVHPDTGRIYEWDGLDDIDSTPVAEAPLWILEALQGKTQGDRRSDKLPIPLELPSGLRNDALAALAGALRRFGLDQHEIWTTLNEVNKRRANPPLPNDEVLKIAESMMRYRPGDKDVYTSTARLWRLLKEQEVKETKHKAATHLEIVDGLTVYRSPATETKCVIDGLLYRGLTVFAGRPKVGKSWLTLEIALNVARGERAMGRTVLQPGRVVYVALEESQSRTSTRMQRLLDVETPLLQNISMVYSLLPLMGGGMAQLDELLANQKPSLVIVDTFLALIKGSGKEKKDVLRSEYSEINSLRELAERHETAILLVHHLRKAIVGEAGIDAVAGSTGVTAAADAIWTIKREDQHLCTLDIVGRECEEQSIGLKFRDGGVGWDVIGDGRALKNMKEAEEILKLLREEGALTVQKVAMLLRLNANRVRDILYDLKQKGAVGKNSGNGAYFPLSDYQEDPA